MNVAKITRNAPTRPDLVQPRYRLLRPIPKVSLVIALGERYALG